jgi:hypothetical protein
MTNVRHESAFYTPPPTTHKKKVVQYYACTIKIIFGRIYEIV